MKCRNISQMSPSCFSLRLSLVAGLLVLLSIVGPSFVSAFNSRYPAYCPLARTAAGVTRRNNHGRVESTGRHCTSQSSHIHMSMDKIKVIAKVSESGAYRSGFGLAQSLLDFGFGRFCQAILRLKYDNTTCIDVDNMAVTLLYGGPSYTYRSHQLR
jgi:hypothetical protein